jgi:excisionase family DNA binding protein
MNKALLNVREVAQLLNVKENTVYDWVSSNFIPHYKISKFVRFRETEVLQWLDKKRIKGRVTRIPDIDLTNITN